jgi:glycosyltransferase involved in cell wall biosynthesis
VEAILNLGVLAQVYAPVLGGAQRQVEALGPLLERRGIAVSVVTRHVPGTPARERQPGVDVRRVWVPSSRAGASIAFSVGAAWTMRRLAVDLIYAQDLLSPTSAALVSSVGARTPVVIKVLSTGPRGDADRLLSKPVGALRLRTILRRSAGFACLSDEVENELLRLGAPREKLFRIQNGVDAEHYRPARDGERIEARRRLGIGGTEVIFLYCGRFASTKRLDLLLRSFARVRGRLVLVGEGNQEPLVRRVIRECDLADRVLLLGKVADPAPLYRAADIYVSASSTEGMSGSVLEAMASAVPVVALRASGMRDLIGEDGGLIVDRPTTAALAEAMRLLATEPSLRTRLGASARRRAVAQYSLEATADKLTTMFVSIIGSSRDGYRGR